MRRKHKTSFENGVYRHYGLLVWKKCCNCGFDFRREKGWRFLSGPYCNGVGKWYYLCEKCAPTFDRANSLAISGCFIPPRPKHAPPSPTQIKEKSND